MTQPTFHDEQSLANAAEDLGNQALQRGLIHSFVVRHFADSRQFYIPDENHDPLTPEEAYMQFKAWVEQAD
ncbi:hypothetical protein C7293_24130 [filamentous cyanobacterium CCT1]|nr:hypothetical protein C7293_24130 [filamentous cyanobacterium CCT1]PSN78650.1 hypothetical protein C8B47_15780 [filamentous cyanobacterium CCP4]